MTELFYTHPRTGGGQPSQRWSVTLRDPAGTIHRADFLLPLGEPWAIIDAVVPLKWGQGWECYAAVEVDGGF